MKVTCVLFSSLVGGAFNLPGTFGTPTTNEQRPYANAEFDQDIANPSQHKVCSCPGTKIFANGQCYDSLNKAVDANPQHDTVIYVASDLTVTSPVSIKYDTSVYGVDCSSTISDSNVASVTKPKIISKVVGVEDVNGVAVDDKGLFMLEGGIFQTLRLKNIDIDFKPDAENGFGHAILAPPNVLSDAHWGSLDIRNVVFSNFISRTWGAVIALQTSHIVNIDENSAFLDNQIKGYCDCYQGGIFAAMYISETSVLNSAATFKNNHVRYKYDWENDRLGSEHAEGGAIYIYYLDGQANLNGKFIGNSACEGGAVNVKTIGMGKLNIDAHFENNAVIDTGAQSRGGAVRVFDNAGDIVLKGTYINNTALGVDYSIPYSGRGAVFAGNYMKYGSSLYVDGVFKDNVCREWGAVISLQGYKNPKGKMIDGKITLASSCVFEGNRALEDEDTNIMWLHNRKELDESEWRGKKITYN